MSLYSCRLGLFSRSCGRLRSYSSVYSGVTTYSGKPECTKYDAVIVGAGEVDSSLIIMHTCGIIIYYDLMYFVISAVTI